MPRLVVTVVPDDGEDAPLSSTSSVLQLDLAFQHCQSCRPSSSPSRGSLEHLADLVTSRLAEGGYVLAAAPSKRTRTHTGCETCKQRRPICANCRKNPNRVCRYALAPLEPVLKRPTKRLRPDSDGNEGESEGLASGERHQPAAAALSVHLPPSESSALAGPGSRAAPAPPLPTPPSAQYTALTSAGSLCGTLHSPVDLPLLPPALLVAYFQQAVHITINVSLAPSKPHRAYTRQTHMVSLLWSCLYSHAERHSRLLLYSALSLGAEHLAYFKPDGEEKDKGRSISAALYKAAIEDAQALATSDDPDMDETVLAAYHYLFYRVVVAIDKDWLRVQNLCADYILSRGGPDTIMQRHANPATRDRIHRHLILLAASDVLAALWYGHGSRLVTSSSSTGWIEMHPQSELVLEEFLGISLCMLFAAVDVCEIISRIESTRASSADPEIAASLASIVETLDVTCPATIHSRSSSARIQAGNLLMRHALLVYLFLHAYHLPARHPRIQQSAAAIKELLIEVTVTTGLVACMNFQLLMGASVAPEADRDGYMMLLDYMSETCGCLDIAAAKRVLREVWRRADAALPDATVRGVVNTCPDLAYLLL
ncbi:hypothetical protein JCM10207_000510 [Rhodosporidiobolus poonsookiae]